MLTVASSLRDGRRYKRNVLLKQVMKTLCLVLMVVSTAKKIKNFPSITPPPIPKSKNLPTSNAVSSTSTSANDIQNVRNDFMAKQQSSQPIKPKGTVGTL